MIVAVTITISLMAIVYAQMWKVEDLERSILSLFAYLKLSDIQQLHDTTLSYLLQITAGSFINQITPDLDNMHLKVNHNGLEEEKDDD